VTGPVAGQGSAIRSGTVPELAHGFTGRPESAPALAAVVPGTAVALVCAAASQPGQPAGSCGKTQLAAHAAQALSRSGQVELLAWIDASSRASALAGYAQAAAAAGIDCAGRAEEVATRLTGWLADTTRPWLMVLDDVRDAADLDGLWHRGRAGRVLITTRDEQAVSGEHGELAAQVIPVGPFTTREALSYLMDRLADDPDQRHGAIDLAIALGGDPLALAQASAVIATTTQSCADYQRHYGDLRARLTRQAHGEPPAPPAVTWMLSAERAGQLAAGPATQILLALAALLDGQAIPAPLFTTPAVCKYLAEAGAPAADPDSAWEAVRALAHAGLLTLDLAPAPPVARVSRLAAALIRAAIANQVLDRAAVVTADALLEIWPQREPRPWLAAGIRSCADALQRTAADRLWTSDACHPLLLKAGHSLDDAGLAGPAVHHWTQLATTSQRILGSDNPHTLTAGTHLAHALLAAGQASEAAAWWQWVIAGRTRACGPDHPDTLAARVSLGRALAAAGQPGNAVTVLEQALADHERVRGPGHPDTLTARAGLAAACQRAGLAAEAIGHYRRILADHERLHGTRHPATMTARQQLAAACLADGRLKDAISAYKKTLADRQHALGADHLDTITTRRDLAAAYQAAGKIAAALQLHEQVCAGHEQILGADHPGTLARRADLASAYLAAGRLADAASMLRDTLTRCEQALPPGAPLTAAVRQALTGLAGP
jgi:tetratricopeptide (TPR) repeat protein